jgi:hypothetical protein
MDQQLAKYVLGFLALIYVLGCVAETFMITNGAQLVFESVKTLVPHMGMFILGFYFSKK